MALPGGFNRTIEELKHSPARECRAGLKVLIVP